MEPRDNYNRTTPGRHGAPEQPGRPYDQARRANGAAPVSEVGHSMPQGGQRPYGAPARPVQGGHQPAGVHAGQPSGYPSSNDDIIRVRKKRRKHKKLKRALLIVAVVLVVLVGGTAAYAGWYTSTLAGNMAMDAQEKSQLDAVLTPADNQQKPFYVLLVGSDNWETYGERSDALVLTRVDPVNHAITMVSVPRDTPYMLNGGKTKINQAFAEGGAVGAVTAVQQLTGVPITYYAEIEFAGLAEFVDSMGGIYVDVPYTIDYEVYTKDQPAVHIEAGNQLLDGSECVALARMRTAYGDDQDAIRQSNVRAMVMALLKSVLQAPPAEIPGLVQRLSACVTTNMELQTMISLAMDFAQSGSPSIYTCTGPYKGDIDPDTGLWLCYENPEGWKALMEAVDAGKNPESVGLKVEGK
ncbi:LCP family protein [Paraeggerthella hongkongensis]|nr:LCP family protein [Paraeggerthella hongkongensis]